MVPSSLFKSNVFIITFDDDTLSRNSFMLYLTDKIRAQTETSKQKVLYKTSSISFRYKAFEIRIYATESFFRYIFTDFPFFKKNNDT